MSDFGDIVTRLVVGSDILRVYPSALVQIYKSETSDLVWEGTADQYGCWEATLSTGKYDIKVDGKLKRTIHHVAYDHTHLPEESWQFQKSGTISADQEETDDMPVMLVDADGSILKVKIVVEELADDACDMTVHLLKSATHTAKMTIASNSIWSHQVNPGASTYRYSYVDDSPDVDLSADDNATIGIDYTAGTIKGLTVLVIFRPDDE